MKRKASPFMLTCLMCLVSAAPASAQSGELLRLETAISAPRLSVDTAGSILARGNISGGPIPMSGTGVRLMWYPALVALRAGYIESGTAWDLGNIGLGSVAWGRNTIAAGSWSTAGGESNIASGSDAVAFGVGTVVSADAGFGAGYLSRCTTGRACVAMGDSAIAKGNAAVALGFHSNAHGNYSVAIGYKASAGGHMGAVVFADASTSDSMVSAADFEFAVRASGGIRLRTNATLTTGCNLPAGSGTWGCTSSRAVKRDFRPVSGEDVLTRLRAVPVNTWSYRTEPGQVRHMGAFAEDFHAAFGLGTDDKSIGLLDMDGVNLAAVRALEARTVQQAEEIRSLKEEVAQLRELVRSLGREAAPR